MACVILSLYFMYGISHDDFSFGGERRLEKLVVYWLYGVVKVVRNISSIDQLCRSYYS